MKQEDRTTIDHPTDEGRWVEIEYIQDIFDYDESTNSCTAYLDSFEIIDQSYKNEFQEDEWDDTSWVTWELVREVTGLR